MGLAIIRSFVDGESFFIYLIMYRLLTFLFLLFFFPFVAIAADNVVSLAQSADWLKLLHYHKTLNGYEGLIRSSSFYISPEGRYNPEAELRANVEAFQNGTEKCRFPARFNLLKDKGLIGGNLSSCDEYQSFLKDVQPAGVTFLFTDAYMNNPASMFGHTLVRIDTARKGTQMLAHGSNFGVTSGSDSGIQFILKGLFGGYGGKYSFTPYWTVINTYNNIENRDIWEYQINLTEEEQIKFVNHLYEMKDAEIQYFFLTKNCSYMILELLEAVRPSLHLSENYNVYAIPLDTLKTVRNVPGLVGKINYRPARYTKIKHQLKMMNDSQYAAFLKGINDNDYDMSDLSEVEQRQVLESEYQYYQYKYTAGDMELKEYRQNSFAVLRRRSRLVAADEVKPEGRDPSLSHGSFQMELNSGVYHKHSFEEFAFRPAYTSLTDDYYGLLKGAGIKVLENRWRYYNQTHKTVLQKLTFLGVDSLVPADRVFSPYSYKTNFSINREYNPKSRKEGYVADVGFGIGKTYTFADWFWVYALLGAKGQYGGFISGNQWLGARSEIGVFNDFNKVRLHNYVEQTTATRHEGDSWRYHSVMSFGFMTNYELKAEYTLSHARSSRRYEEMSVGIQYAF